MVFYNSRGGANFRDDDTMNTQLETGQIQRWFGDRGFGFIRPDDGDCNLFLHIRTVHHCGISEISAGIKVRFERGVGWTGKPEATKVELI